MEGSIPLSVMRAIDNYGSFINASRCYFFKVFAGLAPDVVRKHNFDSAECDEPAILELIYLWRTWSLFRAFSQCQSNYVLSY